MKSPLASLRPRFRASLTPWLRLRWKTRIRGSLAANRPHRAEEPSVDPSSTKISSQSEKVCRITLSMQRCRNFSAW